MPTIDQLNELWNDDLEIFENSYEEYKNVKPDGPVKKYSDPEIGIIKYDPKTGRQTFIPRNNLEEKSKD